MPLYSKPYRNLEQSEKLRKAELLREITSRTSVREDIVELILETFKEVATEEIVNKGEFTFSGLFSVRNHPVKAIRTGIGFVAAQSRLSIGLGDRVKRIWKRRRESGQTEPESFEEMREKYLESDGEPTLRDRIGLLGENDEKPFDASYNPMLDDDDDDY